MKHTTKEQEATMRTLPTILEPHDLDNFKAGDKVHLEFDRMTTQIIYNGSEYVEIGSVAAVDPRITLHPKWPICDEGARWHNEQFEGQAVCYRGSGVHFGLLVEEVTEQELPRDEDGELNFNDLFSTSHGRVYRVI
jgi:hypothetical protein